MAEISDREDAGPAGASTRSLTVIVGVRATGGREAFLAAIAPHAAATREEPGCLRFDVLEAEREPGTFTLVEHYRDRAAFEVHQGTPHLAAWREASSGLIERLGAATWLSVPGSE